MLSAHGVRFLADRVADLPFTATYLESLYQRASFAHLLNPVIALYLKDDVSTLKLSSEDDGAAIL